jgi:alginate O-acetyltransferase complex protein AlgI
LNEIYIAALQIQKTEIKSKRKAWLMLSLIVNLGALFLFKYLNFFADSTRAIFEQFNIFYNSPAFNILLPVGISFYTFQTLSYTIDVYRGSMKAEKDYALFALYVSFFPQLVAGPIERATNLLPQLSKFNKFDYQRIASGLRLMLWGMLKKVVVADRLAIYVNQVYNNVDDYSGLPLLFATVFFAFQIYADFSGYSDIAIGGARVMGVDLMTNFKRPYLSRSIKEFWARWHISLSTWFRDYLYIPLGGNRVVKWRWYYNLFITFLISGLWHGANWTFVIWGALHGTYLIAEIFIKNKQFTAEIPFKVKHVFRVVVTFAFVLVSWVFFRANSIQDVGYIMTNVWDIAKGGIIGVPIFSTEAFIQCFIAIGVLFFADLIYDTVRTAFTPNKVFFYLIVVLQIVAIYMFGIIVAKFL